MNHDANGNQPSIRDVPEHLHSDQSTAELPVESMASVWSPEQAAQFHQRWQDLQLRFVDDPRAAAEEAATLVGEAVDQFSSAIAARRQRWGSDGDDTEQLRMAVRDYRQLLDRLLAT